MRLSAEAKARKSLQDMLEATLSAVPRLTPERIRELSEALAKRIIGNPALLATINQMAPKPSASSGRRVPAMARGP